MQVVEQQAAYVDMEQNQEDEGNARRNSSRNRTLAS
jgi:hypothetical protein